MKRVLILANNAEGLIQFRKELLDSLIEAGHQVYVSVPRGNMYEDVENIGCTAIDTPISRHGVNFIEDLKLLRRYNVLIRKINPSIVFTYTIKPNVYGGIACRINHIPYVVNITGLGSALENRGILQVISVLLYKLGIKKAQMVFFQNKANQQFMLDRHIVTGEHDLLPGSGVNLSKFTMSDYPTDEVVNFLFVGRMMKEKGFDQFLDAAEKIHAKYSQTQFHVCGSFEQDYADRVEKLSRKGIVVYHGTVKDMRPIYAMVSCTVHPTYYPEGMSNVLLESCACGRPIITTDRAGCREIVDDGINGFIVKQKDSEDLIAKLEMFLSLSREARRKMGIAGRKKVEQTFDRTIIVKKYMDML